jgi:hypothetical protein
MLCVLAVPLVFSFIARKSRKRSNKKGVTIEDGGQTFTDREGHLQRNFSTLYLNTAQTQDMVMGRKKHVDFSYAFGLLIYNKEKLGKFEKER